MLENVLKNQRSKPWMFVKIVLGVSTLAVLISPAAIAQVLSPVPEHSSDDQAANVSDFPSGYLLGPGDQIAITVFGYEEYTGSYTILPDGTITLPVVGSIKASTQTSEAFTQRLTARLNEYLVEPVVTVTPIVLRPVVVTIAGEVARPGSVQLRSVTSATVTESTSSIAQSIVAQSPTVSSALLEAGGITSDADIQQIVVKRSIGNGEVVMTTINLWEALVTGDPNQDLILQDGDSIFVPELPENTTLDRRLLASSMLAPDTIPVRVIGEVNAPGQVQVPPESTISSALAIAGGPTEDAQLSQVALMRLNDEGQVEREIIDLRELSDGYQVQEGDVVYVPKQDLRETLDFAGRVFNPLGGLLNLIFGFGQLF